jgi:hypothetical protein
MPAKARPDVAGQNKKWFSQWNRVLWPDAAAFFHEEPCSHLSCCIAQSNAPIRSTEQLRRDRLQVTSPSLPLTAVLNP